LINIIKRLLTIIRLIINNICSINRSIFYSIRNDDLEFLIPWTKTILSKRVGGNSVRSEIPLMPYKVRKWLDNNGMPTWKVFEYGSGGSTLYLSKKVNDVTSIEHNPLFYNYVTVVILNRNICITTQIYQHIKV